MARRRARWVVATCAALSWVTTTSMALPATSTAHAAAGAPATGGEPHANVQAAYGALEVAGGEWGVPAGIRTSVAGADPTAALDQMAAATAVLASRDDAARKATDLGLSLPAGAEEAYEAAGADGDTAGDLAAVSAALDEQHLALATLFEVDGARVDAEEQLAAFGLGVDLTSRLAGAREAFEAGDLGAVLDLADGEAGEVAEWVAAGELLASTIANADASRGVVERIGLLGGDADATVADARRAFTSGDRVRAAELATDAQEALDDAGSTGARRVVLAVAAALLAAVAAAVLVRRSRARRTPRETTGDATRPAEDPG